MSLNSLSNPLFDLYWNGLNVGIREAVRKLRSSVINRLVDFLQLNDIKVFDLFIAKV